MCELNVITQVDHVAQTTIVRDAWNRGQYLKIHGWVYGIQDGLVKDLAVTVDNYEMLDSTIRSAVDKVLGKKS